MFDRSFTQCLIILCCLLAFCTCGEDCVKRSPCTCEFSNKTKIDISSLGNLNGTARFLDTVSTADTNYTYLYNPCYGFTQGASSPCKDVAVCQTSSNEEMYSLGSQASAVFYVNNSVLMVNYTGRGTGDIRRTASIKLICDNSETTKFTAEGENPSTFYHFTLRSKCACPDGCSGAKETSDSLSTGSILVILLFVFVLCYIFGGIIYQKVMKGARGKEIFPNYEFWMDFPLLVRDGVIFTCNGCQNEVSYERI